MSSAKENAKKRDGQECRFCGMTDQEHRNQHGRGLHAHHIIKDRKGGKDIEENYITVCRSCHNVLENTQAEALSRIKQEHMEEVREELRADYEIRISELEERLEALISVVHGIERNRVQNLSEALEGKMVNFHLVSTTFGSKSNVTEDRNEAVDWYDKWGSKLRRANVSVDEANSIRLAERVVRDLRRRW